MMPKRNGVHEIVSLEGDKGNVYNIIVTAECLDTQQRVRLEMEEEYHYSARCPACDETVRLALALAD